MRRTVEAAGAIGSLLYILLTQASRLSNFFGIVGLPEDVGKALVIMSSAPTLISLAVLALGLFCASFLIRDSGYDRTIWRFLVSFRWRSPLVRLRESQAATELSATNSEKSSKPTLQRPLDTGLYVGQIALSLGALEAERRAEISIVAYNGTGTTIELNGISGAVCFGVAGDSEPAARGALPTPSMRADISKTAGPSQEWSITLDQRIPANTADLLLRLMNEKRQIHFTFGKLKIEIVDQANRNRVARLPLWDGLSFQWGLWFSRIKQASINFGIGAAIGQPSPIEIPRDMTMTEALEILNEASEYPGFQDVLYQSLFDGKVLAWGRKQLNQLDADELGPYQLIRQDYWSSGRLSWITTGAGGTERAERENELDYTRIRFNAEQIRKLAQNITIQNPV